MTTIERARDAFQQRYEAELSECATIAAESVDSDVTDVEDVTADVTFELSNELLVLGGAVKALEVVDVPDTRLDSVLDGVCPHCYCKLHSFDLQRLQGTETAPPEMAVYCTQGHETKFYDEADFRAVRRNAGEIFVGAGE